jgi:hypothetical protein
MSTALALPFGLGVEAFCRSTSLHPQLVAQLVRLGLLEPVINTRGVMMFAFDDVARVARMERLRRGLSLNYAALGLVLDLLDRIEVLENTTDHGRVVNVQWT